MIYLDNNATTQIDAEILETVQTTLAESWGNPSSTYSFGIKSKNIIEQARLNVASLIGLSPSEVIFTSGATESNNMAFYSAIQASKTKKHIVTSVVEHSSILEICKYLSLNGYKITYLPVDANGMLNLNDLEEAITDETALVSLMYANNETGVIFPIEQIFGVCSKKGVLFHCDAVQAVGKVNVSCNSFDYLSISGHKFYAPKGIGGLCIRNNAPTSPIIHGGGQEWGYRGGTYNTSYIAGLGHAAQKVSQNIMIYQNEISKLREYFENRICSSIPGAYINGRELPRIPNTSNFGISGFDSEIIINYLNQFDIFIASGSACSSQAITPSHVITAMKGYDCATEALRVSFSIYNTLEEVDMLLEKIYDLYFLLT